MGYLSKINDYIFCERLQNAINGRDSKELEKIKLAMQAFVNKPKTLLQKKIQAVGVSTDFAQITKDSFNVTIENDNFDMGWEKAFRSVPLGKNQDSWEIYNVSNTITFVKVEEGARIEMNELAGTKTTAYVDYYGGAVGWTDKMIRFRKVPAMIDIASVFRNKFWTNKADNHYALLAAAIGAGNTTAYQGAAADGQLRRDIQTINLAAFTLGDTLKDKGYGDMATAPFLMYANPFDEDRIEAAFRALTGGMAHALRGAEQITRRKITRIYTYNSNITSGLPLLVLPGQKIQKAEAMAPTTYIADKDPFTLNEAQAVWSIYGAIVADTDQLQAVTLS